MPVSVFHAWQGTMALISTCIDLSSCRLVLHRLPSSLVARQAPLRSVQCSSLSRQPALVLRFGCLNSGRHQWINLLMPCMEFRNDGLEAIGQLSLGCLSMGGSFQTTYYVAGRNRRMRGCGRSVECQSGKPRSRSSSASLLIGHVREGPPVTKELSDLSFGYAESIDGHEQMRAFRRIILYYFGAVYSDVIREWMDRRQGRKPSW